MRCSNCGAQQYTNQIGRAFACQSCSRMLTSCERCEVGPHCPSCQKKANEKVHTNGLEYYLQLKEIASILNIPLNSRQSYNLTDSKWSSFFPNQVRQKWEQLKTAQLTPETQQSELFAENRQLTTDLTLKDRELKDLQAEIRALHTQLNEKENSSPWQTKINKLETKLNLVKKKLGEWSGLLTK